MTNKKKCVYCHRKPVKSVVVSGERLDLCSRHRNAIGSTTKRTKRNRHLKEAALFERGGTTCQARI